MACQVARQCLREENPVQDHSSRPLVEGDDGGAIFSSRSASAAAVLTNLALTRLSRDNISYHSPPPELLGFSLLQPSELNRRAADNSQESLKHEILRERLLSDLSS
ncbi:hypothetical protein RND71_030100 [Anisodus tanguticus]|uniref:Uncharacterized protein n=1 Tax=Anisodus tanguticus TaxID=243964 RepID=A0AAE1RH29_9SOLA|nr:hypothetical protein RND71_030100 [Anisodus tanguticus]